MDRPSTNASSSQPMVILVDGSNNNNSGGNSSAGPMLSFVPHHTPMQVHHLQLPSASMQTFDASSSSPPPPPVPRGGGNVFAPHVLMTGNGQHWVPESSFGTAPLLMHHHQQSLSFPHGGPATSVPPSGPTSMYVFGNAGNMPVHSVPATMLYPHGVPRDSPPFLMQALQQPGASGVSSTSAATSLVPMQASSSFPQFISGATSNPSVLHIQPSQQQHLVMTSDHHHHHPAFLPMNPPSASAAGNSMVALQLAQPPGATLQPRFFSPSVGTTYAMPLHTQQPHLLIPTSGACGGGYQTQEFVHQHPQHSATASTQRNGAGLEEGTTYLGTVKRYNPARGYGFIRTHQRTRLTDGRDENDDDSLLTAYATPLRRESREGPPPQPNDESSVVDVFFHQSSLKIPLMHKLLIGDPVSFTAEKILDSIQAVNVELLVGERGGATPGKSTYQRKDH